MSYKKTIKTIGIDGCKGGWMVVVFEGSDLHIEKHDRIDAVMATYPAADKYLIDIPIGLADSREEAAFRPDSAARRILKRKASSIFPAPFRSVARAGAVSEAWDISRKLEARTSYMTMGIRGAANDVDLFLQNNPTWKNVLCESHPELCFTILNGGEPILEKKTEAQGVEKRLTLLQKYGVNMDFVAAHPLFLRYRDDVIDAICLALVGKYAAEGKSATIPCAQDIKTDATGLKMQMIIPDMK